MKNRQGLLGTVVGERIEISNYYDPDKTNRHVCLYDLVDKDTFFIRGDRLSDVITELLKIEAEWVARYVYAPVSPSKAPRSVERAEDV